MERYLMLLGVALAVVAFVPAIFFFLRASHQFVLMLGHYRSGEHRLAANLLPFLAPFMPQVFTDQGNVHRRAFLSSLFWSVCCAGFIAVMYAILGIGYA
jgi:hypothetical protein